MSSKEEQRYIKETLIPEILADFERWGKEYQQPRDLGIRGEFAGLYRKARKLKTLFWDHARPVAGTEWREGPRTILKEVIAHALLMLLDLDRERNPEDVPGPPTPEQRMQRAPYLLKRDETISLRPAEEDLFEEVREPL